MVLFQGGDAAENSVLKNHVWNIDGSTGNSDITLYALRRLRTYTHTYGSKLAHGDRVELYSVWKKEKIKGEQLLRVNKRNDFRINKINNFTINERIFLKINERCFIVENGYS